MADIQIMGKLVSKAAAETVCDAMQVQDVDRNQKLDVTLTDLYSKIGSSSKGGDTMNFNELPSPADFTAGQIINLTSTDSVEGSYVNDSSKEVVVQPGIYRLVSGKDSNYWNLMLSSADVQQIYTNKTNIDNATAGIDDKIEGKQDKLVAGSGISIKDNTISVDLDTAVYKVSKELPTTPTSAEQRYIYMMIETVTIDGVDYVYDPANGLHAFAWVGGAWMHIGQFVNSASDDSKVAIQQALTDANKVLCTDDSGKVYCATGELLSKDEKEMVLYLAKFISKTTTITRNSGNNVNTQYGNPSTINATYGLKTTTMMGKNTTLEDVIVGPAENPVTHAKLPINAVWRAKANTTGATVTLTEDTYKNTAKVSVATTATTPLGTYGASVNCKYEGKDLVTVQNPTITVYLPTMLIWCKLTGDKASGFQWPALDGATLNAAMKTANGNQIQVSGKDSGFYLDTRGKDIYTAGNEKFNANIAKALTSGYVGFYVVTPYGVLLNKDKCLTGQFAMGLEEKITNDKATKDIDKYMIQYSTDNNMKWQVYKSNDLLASGIGDYKEIKITKI